MQVIMGYQWPDTPLQFLQHSEKTASASLHEPVNYAFFHRTIIIISIFTKPTTKKDYEEDKLDRFHR